LVRRAAPGVGRSTRVWAAAPRRRSPVRSSAPSRGRR
jgi:hypothetical protein